MNEELQVLHKEWSDLSTRFLQKATAFMKRNVGKVFVANPVPSCHVNNPFEGDTSTTCFRTCMLPTLNKDGKLVVRVLQMDQYVKTNPFYPDQEMLRFAGFIVTVRNYTGCTWEDLYRCVADTVDEEDLTQFERDLLHADYELPKAYMVSAEEVAENRKRWERRMDL